MTRLLQKAIGCDMVKVFRNHYLLVCQHFSGFHGTDYGSIDSMTAILVNIFNNLLPLILGRERNLQYTISSYWALQ